MAEAVKGGVMMTLNRNFVLATTSGHAVKFEKDVPTFVPHAIYKQAVEVGAVRADGDSANVIEDPKIKRAPQDAAERAVLIMAAIKEVVARNDAAEFAASGMPMAKVISRIVDFTVNNKEVASVWQTYHDEQAAAA